MPDLEPFLEALRLKELPRTGWVRQGVSAPESVAAHSWGLGWLVVALLPDDLDRGRALSYAVLHDLPEVRIGDLTPADGVTKDEKSRLEHRAMRAICDQMPNGERLWDLFVAYEAQADPESRFVRECDRLDMALQAVVYAERGARGMAQFLDSAAKVVRHPALVPYLEACRERLAGR